MALRDHPALLEIKFDKLATMQIFVLKSMQSATLLVSLSLENLLVSSVDSLKITNLNPHGRYCIIQNDLMQGKKRLKNRLSSSEENVKVKSILNGQKEN